MAVGDKRIYAARSATHGTTAINSVTHFGVATSSSKARDPGAAGSPGPAEEITTDRNIAVTIFALDPDELMALVEAAAANLVVTVVGEAGATKTLTIKNVVFNDPPSVDAPAKDAGGVAGVSSISGVANWGTSDTWALMMVWS